MIKKTIEHKGDVYGYFVNFVEENKPRERWFHLPTVPTELMELELKRRREFAPFVDFGNQIIRRAKDMGVRFKREMFVYSRHIDVIHRPEMFFGYIFTEMSLRAIFAEDEMISRGKLPERKRGEGRIEWTDRVVLRGSKDDQVQIYASRPEYNEHYINEFLTRVKKRLD